MSQETTLRGLVETRRLVSYGWTQGAFARDHNAAVVPYNSVAAVCFCLEGALVEAAHLLSYTKAEETELLDAVRAEIGGFSIAEFNDDPYRQIIDILWIIDAAAMRTKGDEEALRTTGRMRWMAQALGLRVP